MHEIYVTLFTDRPELRALYDLLVRWGFCYYGTKTSNGKTESVLIKRLGIYDETRSVIENFPNINKNKEKMILPILPQYHTNIFPDSKLKTEKNIDFLNNVAYRYALKKVYVSWAPENNINPGDLLVFYRMGDTSPKKYSSVLTTIGVVEEVVSKFSDEKDFLNHCQNRSVFTVEELKNFWRNHRYNLKIIKFIYVKSLSNRKNLDYLWQHNIVSFPNGPRPFTRISDNQFEMILKDSNTEIFI